MYNYNYSEDYLMHYGVKGMKWGVRRAARANARDAYKETLASTSRIGNSHYTRVRKAKKAGQQAYKETVKSARAEAKATNNTPEAIAARKEKQKKALKVGAVAAGTALAAYGAYKLGKHIQYNNSLKKAVEEGRKSVENNMSKAKSDPFAAYRVPFGAMSVEEYNKKAPGGITIGNPTAEQRARVEAVRKADREFHERAKRTPRSLSPEEMTQLRRAGFKDLEDYYKNKDWVYR